MRIRILFCLWLAGFGSMPLSAAQPPLTFVWLQNNSSRQEGQGFFVKGANGCFLLTAAHVLGTNGDVTDTVTFRMRGGTARIGNVRWAPPAGVNYDVGVIEASAQDTPTDCPSFPSPAQVDAALSVGRGELVLVDQGGDRFRVPVVIVRESPQIVVRLVSRDDQVQQGYSGGALVVDGVIVGVISSVDNRKSQPEIQVGRIDAAPPEARNYLTLPTAQGQESIDSLAALEAALRAGKSGGRQRALAMALGSKNSFLRATALRYAICDKSALSISTTTIPPTLSMYRYMRYMFGLVTVPIGRCQVENGSFDVSAVPTGEDIRGPMMTAAGGQVSGTRVSMRFATGRPTLKQKVICTAEFQLADGERLVGQLSCAWDDAIFASQAVVNL